jgi:hypothetical protein
MKYAKPQITLISRAIETVQNSDIKHEQMIVDSYQVLATTAAYQADE